MESIYPFTPAPIPTELELKQSQTVSVQQEQYKDLLSHLDPSKINEIEAHLNRLNPQDIQKLSVSIQQGTYIDDPLFNQKGSDYDIQALAAFRDQLISESQFVTVMVARAALVKIQETEITPIKMSVFEKDATNLIKKTFEATQQGPGIYISDYLNTNQTAEFFERLKELPVSEQQFFLMPDERDVNTLKNPNSDTDISLTFEYGSNFNVFGHVEYQQQMMRMVPSYGMIEAILKVKFGDDRVEPRPILGIFSASDLIQMIKENKRDVAVPFDLVPLPKEADDFKADDFSFFKHDVFHLNACSAIYPEHRFIFGDLIDALKHHYLTGERQTTLENIMDAFSNLILDFDFPNYRQEDPEYDKNSRQAFWYSFLNSFIRGANTLAVQNSSTSSFEYMATFLNSDVLSEVAAFLTAGSLKDTSRSLSSQLSCKGLIAYITSTVKSTHLSSLQQNVIDQIKKKSIDGTVEALNKIEQEEDDVTVSDIANVVFFLLGEQLIATQQKTNIKV